MIRLFRVFIPVSVFGLLLSEILLAFGCYVAAFLMMSDELFDVFYLYEGGLDRTAVVVGSIILGAYFNDLYSDLRVVSRLRLAQQFCLVMGMAFLVQALLSYLSPELILGRWQMITGSGLALVMLPLWRMAYDRFVIRAVNRQRVLLVGTNSVARTIASTVADRPEFGLAIAGYLSDEEAEDAEGLGAWLGPVSSLKKICAEMRPDLVVIGMTERRGSLPVYDLLNLRLSGKRVEDASTLYETVMWRVPVETLRPSQLLFSSELGPNPRSLSVQRIYNYALALAVTLVTLPLMALVALAVRLTSKGPVIYRQPRVGRDGRVFEVYKFRSMRSGAEENTGAVWAQRNDPRVTPLGRWLRLLRLDELPQLFNVLKGEMAIVGPRPERPEFVKVLTEQIPFYGQRHAILPGITGWAQINHQYSDSIEDTITKLEYDLYYLKHLSLSLDMYILFHTVKVMLLGKGSR